MNTIKECFDTILKGSKEESRLAARKVRKLLYGSHGNCDEFIDIKNLINSASDEYDKISEDWRQENFVTAVSVIYYLHDKEGQPDFLFPWLFQLLEHPNGVIRYAAVRMISNEIGPLTVHIRLPGDKSILGDKLKPDQADAILNSLFIKLNELGIALRQPKYKRYKYIDSLPASPYKSVMMVLAELEESRVPEESGPKEEQFEEGEEMTEEDLCDTNCPMCQATKFHLRFGRYPDPRELAEFLKEEKGRC